MAVSTVQHATRRLRLTLWIDGTLTALAGLALLAAAQPLASFSGLGAPLQLTGAGGLLLLFGGLLLWATATPQPAVNPGWTALLLCGIWALSGLMWLGTRWPALTNGGRWLLSLAVLAELLLGLMHWLALRSLSAATRHQQAALEQQTERAARPRRRRSARTRHR